MTNTPVSTQPVKLAPGEWKAGPFIANYDEHLRAYFIYPEYDLTAQVGIVKRLTDFGRFVDNQKAAA